MVYRININTHDTKGRDRKMTATEEGIIRNINIKHVMNGYILTISYSRESISYTNIFCNWSDIEEFFKLLKDNGNIL
jgi:hypothetical protein